MTTRNKNKNQIQRRQQDTSERKPNWKEVYASVEDIKTFLSDRIVLRHNVVTRRVEFRLPSSYEHEGTDWHPINDRIVNSLWAELSKQKPTRVQDIYRVIESDYTPDFHPFRFYLEHLPKWDGQDYILGMSVSVSVKGDSEMREQMLFAKYLKKWLVGMVAGWVDPTVVNNVILVLIGEQGSYKTTWFNHLLPPELKQYFYTKTNANRMGRDDLLTLAQYGLVCCEELDTMRAAELNQLKAAVTMPSIDERAAYARYHEHRIHIASFCGTGNNAQFLSDPTGNRRWLPFEVESIESPRDHPFNYAGIYSQAYALYQEGFKFWFSREEIQQLSVHNSQFETPRLEYELVQMYFRKPEGQEPGEFISVALAMQLVCTGVQQKISSVLLGRAFVELGFERKTSRNVRGYVAVRRSVEEMRVIRNIMAQEARHTDTDDTDVF
ncbi:virulence-associated E family protein [Prevotella sp. E15-22]|uniref:virulence-associated E family protein n=1 Tax=Prevotella sp. E15-22 TaxID=2937774 RepID=UPI00204B4D14|nr:virulence-associated E family protein [Prevotella sp. E15-22]UPS45030.1 virulence-associated E family protein [Prevotella sp. E15-22]